MENYEEKYKQALERAEFLTEKLESNHIKGFIYSIFPELLESEDEKIRKTQLNYWRSVGGKEWHGVPVQEVIAWLEKQGKQKPADKVEPKFNVGDLIICFDEDEEETSIPEKVVEFFGNKVRLIDIDGVSMICPKSVLKQYHLWTIQDAKDGDVLVAKIDEEPNDFIYIFKEYDQNLGFWSHCYLDAYLNKFHEGIYHNNCNIGVPATKEQYDILFSKMKEAGYEWDAEKKELKKIEQKSAWSEEDEKKRQLLIKVLEVNHPNAHFKVNPINTINMEAMSSKELVDWLKSLKDKVQPQPKQEWSEKIENILII